jgi:hypothetical protein
MNSKTSATRKQHSEVLKWPNSFYDRGKEEGKREGNKETAIRLMEMGVDLLIVTKATGLTREELIYLKK